MAEFDISPESIEKARSSGYSDDEIVNHLSTQMPDKFSAAQQAGYSSKEILDHFSPVPPIGQELGKTIPSALGRGIIAAATGVPTIADLAASGADWLGGKALTPESAENIHSKIESVHKGLSPFTYGPVLEKAEALRQQYAEPGGVPLTYQPKGTVNKLIGTPLEFAPSAVMGATGIMPKLAGAGPNMVRALTGGLASEGAGELAEKYLPEGAVPYVRGVAGLVGASHGLAGARRLTTPLPASAEHQAAVDLMKRGGATDAELTAGAATGNSWAKQTESNLAKPGVLGAQDNSTFTKVIANEAGMPNTPNITAQALADTQKKFNDYNDVIKSFEIKGALPGNPSNFNDMQAEIAATRAKANRALFGHMDTIDDVVKDLKGGPGALSMTGQRYADQRQRIQQAIEDSKSAAEKSALIEMRQSLDKAMSKELPAGSKDLNQHYLENANFNILKNSPLDKNGQVTPSQMKKAIVKQWGQEAYNKNRGMSEHTKAGELLFGDRPAKVTEPSEMTKGAAAATGFGLAKLLGSQEPAFAGYFGKEALASLYQKVGRAAGRPIYFNPMVQSLLKMQTLPAGPATEINKAMAARLLARPGAANLQTRLSGRSIGAATSVGQIIY